MQLKDEQIKAIEIITQRRISVISGPPGSGKTTLIKEAIVALSNLEDARQTIILTPTGAASYRVTFQTGLEAFTVDYVWFSEFLISKYEGCNVIIDESSMVDIDKAQQVKIALKPNRICFVGDEKQLTCVSGFSVLKTLLHCDSIPRAYLTLNHRQNNLESGLVKTLAALGTSNFTQPFTDESLKLVIGDTIDDCVTKATNLFLTNPKMQMLATTNAIVNKLNFNTRGSTNRVICTKNLYDTTEKSLLVANGILGNYDVHNKTINYENGFSDISKAKGKSKFKTMFKDARCITVHLSQGNEFNEFGLLFVAENKTHGIPIELTYTALSRFKNGLYVVGTRTAIKLAFCGKFQQDNYEKRVVNALERSTHKKKIKFDVQ